MPVRWVLTALGVQIVLAVAILKVDFIWSALSLLSRGVATLDQASREGAVFVFGYAGGGLAPFPLPDDGTSVIVAF